MRHLFKPLSLLIIITTLIAACSPTPTPPPAATSAPEATTAPTEPTTAPEANAYPVTIDHKYGSTTIEEYPERIVLVGLNEQDSLLALGVVPVATREWYGERPGAIFEWATDELGSAEVPVVLSSGELSFEQIAGLQPDVIVGLYAGLTQEEYDTLSQIAPTVAQPAEYVDWGIPWQEVTRTMGKIVGKSAEADALVTSVEAKIATAREQHPEFIGATGVFASTYGYPDTFWAFSKQDVRGRLLTELGFELPDELTELTSDGYGASISRERLDLLDLNTIVWVVDTDEEAVTLKADALYQQLNAVKEGRDIIFTGSNQMYDALNFSSVLSLPYVIDELVPYLAAAVDGDPETVVTP
jgi:iron complex transport system substrate-binding protein